MCGCLILVTTNNKNFSTLVVICEYCYYCYRDRDHFCRHFRWSFLLPKSTRDNNHESIRDGNFMQEILWNKRNGVVPIFSCWKKISTQKKKKKGVNKKQQTYSLSLELLCFVLVSFSFSFWFLGSYQNLQNKTLHESFHKNSHRKQTFEEEAKKETKVEREKKKGMMRMGTKVMERNWFWRWRGKQSKAKHKATKQDKANG